MALLSAIRNAGWRVRYYARSSRTFPDSPGSRLRQRAVREMVQAVRVALDEAEDPEAVLAAIVDSLVPRDDRLPF